MNILEKIVKHKEIEVASRKAKYPVALLEESLYMESPTLSLSGYITRQDKSGIIAEFKRRSPSKPEINLYADVEEVSIGYMQAGASALSILTDEYFFGGSKNDLTTARKFNFCPILRKDFIIDEYQIIEARSIGADAILLIAEILTGEQIKRFSNLASSLNMEVLLELHSEDQLSKFDESIRLLGVNNRDLNTFRTDINFSKQLLKKLPSDVVKVSESGISSVEAIVQLRSIGYQGFLIGEKFMASPHPEKTCLDFIKSIPA